MEYVQNFQWEQTKYNSGRSLVELAGMISDRMKLIDSDIKKQQDEMSELRNQFSAMVKKEGTSFTTMDISEAIYSS